jgi:hypothetical protein
MTASRLDVILLLDTEARRRADMVDTVITSTQQTLAVQITEKSALGRPLFLEASRISFRLKKIHNA